MKPIEFVTHIEQHNTPFGSQMEAICTKSIRITDGEKVYRVLSYYLNDDGHMWLDIEPTGKLRIK